MFIADMYKTAYEQSAKCDDVTFSFYTFGWNGMLDADVRKEGGVTLYAELVQEIERLKKKIKDKELVVEILAHSHGGNVVLNLAAAEKECQKNLVVDRFVLFGTPVQSETGDFVDSPVFKKVYNVYSTADPVQLIDFISTQDNFSKRRFSSSFSNLTQIEVHVGNMRPLHNELWFLKENGNLLYRNDFALNPLPVSIFTPMITNLIDYRLPQAKDLFLHLDKIEDDLIFTFHEKQDAKNHESPLSSEPIKCSYSFPHLENLKNQMLEKSV